MIKNIEFYLSKIKTLLTRPAGEETKKVYEFFLNYEGFRSLNECAKYTGIDIQTCSKIKKTLYDQRKLGLYYFEANVSPQKYMKEYIKNKFSDISFESYILEVGPGEYPIFDFKEYCNWYAADKNFNNGIISFKDFSWAEGKYPKNKIINAGWENISEEFRGNGLESLKGKFDCVVASHSYEHTFKPIKSLIEAGKMLKSSGAIILFVPDAYTDDINTKDPTHTLYIVPEMIKEFFHYAGCFKDIEVRSFRPNADLVITAIKE